MSLVDMQMHVITDEQKFIRLLLDLQMCTRNDAFMANRCVASAQTAEYRKFYLEFDGQGHRWCYNGLIDMQMPNITFWNNCKTINLWIFDLENKEQRYWHLGWSSRVRCLLSPCKCTPKINYAIFFLNLCKTAKNGIFKSSITFWWILVTNIHT